MDFEVKNQDNVLVVTPTYSDLDASAATKFKSKFSDLMQEGSKKFILNLSHINFIDSSGLGAIIRTSTLLDANKGSIVLCNVSETVLSLLKIVRLDQLIKIFPDENESITYFKNITDKK
jgi:anti-sigma B factor antagonist